MKKVTSLEALVNCLQRAEEISIVSHTIPDGDSIGSSLGMGLVLSGLGKQVRVVLNDQIPRSYRFLSGHELVSTPSETRSAQVVLFLDCADEKRIGDFPTGWFDGAEVIVNIDHHISNTLFGQHNWVLPDASSTSEICVGVVDSLGARLDPAIATAFYTGIVMDTGSFQYASTSPQTLKTASRLLAAGAALNQMREHLFESRSLAEIEVLRTALNSLTLTQDGRVAWMVLSYEDVLRLGSQDEHYEGIINYPRSIEGVEVGLLFRELRPGLVKVGLRSRGKVDVNEIAALFGGGGHRLAAGARFQGMLAEAVSAVIRATEERLDGRFS